MVQEIRQIMLTEDELVHAIEAYRKVVPGFLPPGKITHCLFADEETVTVSIETPCNDGVKPVTFILQGFDIVEALITFCIQRNIPLPREGKKSANIKAKAASLWVTVNLNTETPAWVAPMQQTHLTSLVEASPADIVLEENCAVCVG